MLSKLLLSSALALAPMTALHAASLSDVFTSFYVLGDSNSDFGNLGTNGPPPPYFNSQFSNGPVWADILDDQFQTGDPNNIRTWNYAFGGARVIEGSNVPDLPTQLQVFGADLDPNVPDPLDGTPVLGDRPLVSVWFGVNDLRGIYQTYLAAVDAAGLWDVAAQALALDQAEAVARAAAAQVGQIYGATLEAVAQTPGFNDLLSFTTVYTGDETDGGALANTALPIEMSVLFNTALAGSLSNIENTGVSVYTVDIFDLQQRLATDAGAFGITNITDACLTFDENGPNVCANPDTYLSWDEIGHLSGAAHAALAGIVEQTVLDAQPNVAPVPLPGGLPALGAGLLMLGLLRKRRARAA